MSTKTKRFHIGDVLSVTTGRLVSARHMEGVYDILNYMTGESLFTHALIRAAEVCAPVLLQQHPDLADVKAEGITKENWRAWLDEQIARFGEYRKVVPLKAGVYEAKDPITELIDMGVPREKIIPVVLP